MEKITFHYSAGKKSLVSVRYRIRDGRKFQISHTSGIKASIEDLEKFEVTGVTKDGIRIYNRQLSDKLRAEYSLMQKALQVMKANHLDMTSEEFEMQIQMINNPEDFSHADESAQVVDLFRKVNENAFIDGFICAKRRDHIEVVIKKLERFLTIKGQRTISAAHFTERHILDFKNFITEEYKYVSQYPSLYGGMSGRNIPTAPLSKNTVVSQLKMLKTFFSEIESSGKIDKSPFGKISNRASRRMMQTRYDEPFYLRKEELMKVMAVDNPNLQEVKETFLVQCAFGARIEDMRSFTMKNIAVSDEGIPYLHYIPHKTRDVQSTNEEVKTPIMRFAFDIIVNRNFIFPVLSNIYGEDGYNNQIKLLLRVANLDRLVNQYDETAGVNVQKKLYEVASTKICRKTHVDMIHKVQIDKYAAQLHKRGSGAVDRYTSLEIRDQFALMNRAFGQQDYRVNKELQIRN